jgi:hypothetical protein
MLRSNTDLLFLEDLDRALEGGRATGTNKAKSPNESGELAHDDQHHTHGVAIPF